jgi:hypothetical protein
MRWPVVALANEGATFNENVGITAQLIERAHFEVFGPKKAQDIAGPFHGSGGWCRGWRAAHSESAA